MMTNNVRPVRRLILPVIAGLIVLAGLCAAWLIQRDARPNILLIVVDDLGFEVLSCYGGQSYDTPNIDRLAAGGTRFTQCYGTPICTPSRAQILSGRYPSHTGITRMLRDLPPGTLAADPARQPQLGAVLQSAGYATAVVGKWALADLRQYPTHVNDCGFDEYSLWVRWPRENNEVGRYWKPNVLENGQLLETSMRDYGPDLATDYLIDFIRRNRSRPFLAYYPMTLVHGPFSPPPTAPGGKMAYGKHTTDLNNFDDMVRYMDGLVGRIVDELDRLGIRDNTLILITADNGSPGSITSLMDDEEVEGGKRTLTDRGIRLPLIANQPGAVPAGRVYDELVDLSDLLPTLADVAGADLPRDRPALDGRSFADQLRGTPGPTRDWVISQLHDDLCIRTKRWKLMSNGLLYDLRADPTEEAPIDTAAVTGESARAVAALAPILQRHADGLTPEP